MTTGGEKTILIIDDDPLFTRMYERIFTRSGWGVVVARDGKVGLTLMKSKNPDVVVLDLLMPETNGFEVLRVAKGDAAIASIPIIVLTSLSDGKNREACLAAGAAGYFVKGSGANGELLERLKTILGS